MGGGRWIAVLATAMVAATTTTQPTTCQSQAIQAGCVLYTTGLADTPYSLGERFYGKGWMGDRIAKINPGKLTATGVFLPRVQIVIPPGLDGLPVDVGRSAENSSY